MGHLFVHSRAVGALAFAGALLLAVPAMAQGAGGFEAAPGSAPIVTSNGMPVVNMATPAPISGAAAAQQPNYSAFGDAAPPGMYVAPLGYGAGTGAGAGSAPPVYSAQSAPANSTYSIQQQPISGPYAQQQAQPQPYYAPQANPYANPYAPPPPPNAYGAPMPDYTPQPYASPYAPQPYAQPAPYMAQPQNYAAQSGGQQNSPYTAAQRMVQGLPPTQQSYPQQPYAQPQPYALPMQPAAAANPQMAVPYSAGMTAYGAPLPRNVAMPGQGQVEGGYTLGPGDKVRVTIFGEQDLSGEYQLDGNGNIRLPLVGMTRAIGYTAGGLEAAIRAALVPNYLRDPRINVEITGYRPIYVVGAVQKPGQYTYVSDMTLLNAVALAGGFTSQAKDSTVYVRHEGATEERAMPTNMPLLIRPGDTVRVETTIFWDVVNFFGPLSSPVALAATVR